MLIPLVLLTSLPVRFWNRGELYTELGNPEDSLLQITSVNKGGFTCALKYFPEFHFTETFVSKKTIRSFLYIQPSVVIYYSCSHSISKKSNNNFKVKTELRFSVSRSFSHSNKGFLWDFAINHLSSMSVSNTTGNYCQE